MAQLTDGVDRFKYQLFLGLDANFRMESKLRKKSRNKSYPILSDGLGCVVPSGNYAEHLKNYVTEEDVSDSYQCMFSLISSRCQHA